MCSCLRRKFQLRRRPVTSAATKLGRGHMADQRVNILTMLAILALFFVTAIGNNPLLLGFCAALLVLGLVLLPWVRKQGLLAEAAGAGTAFALVRLIARL